MPSQSPDNPGVKHFTSVSVSTTPVLLAAGYNARSSVLIQNVGNADVYVGASNVSTTLGVKLLGGQTPPATLTDTTSQDDWWGVTGSGTTTLTVCDIY